MIGSFQNLSIQILKFCWTDGKGQKMLTKMFLKSFVDMKIIIITNGWIILIFKLNRTVILDFILILLNFILLKVGTRKKVVT